AVMAAHGSGACARSESVDGEARTVLNVDMGGGTAKLAICRDGEIVETAAINVGARLVAMDERGLITRIEPAGLIVAEELGIPLEVGGTLSETQQREMAEVLADCVLNLAERRPLGALADRLMITDPLSFDGPIDAVTFSGGVSEYVYGNESRNFGDLGILLGQAVRAGVDRLGAPIEASEQQIRATVIGAGQYTLQVSGSTIFISRPDLLPLRNMPVVAPIMPSSDYTLETVRESVQRALARLDIEEGAVPVAISIRWKLEPSYERVRTLAAGIVAALPRTIAQGIPLTLVFDTDIAGAIGIMLTEELVPSHDVVSIDEVQVTDLDYIDLAEEREDVRAVPVIVKSLVFTTPRERSSGLIWGTAAAPQLHEAGPGSRATA
ncbi:MAG: ethanolamine ammonia-lyase reactivating factor EutA, partial [Chloroflexi bacterium]|nr:ethanolamine ammonia-lyase reactivating factor EutA [Chloroflexota bacterium]